MTKQKSTKRALLLSALSLLMCVSMLIGSTFAWFTDSVTSSGNIIKSGSLKVMMNWADGTKEVPAKDSASWINAENTPIFAYTLWEPGYTQVRHIQIKNTGSLALKYELFIEVLDEEGKVVSIADMELAKVIDVYFSNPAVQIADRTDLNENDIIGVLAEATEEIPGSTKGELLAGESTEVTLALKMQESAGNEYQDIAVGASFNIKLVATQLTYEEDSYDETYDESAKYPLGKDLSLGAEFNGYKANVEVPAEAPGYDYSELKINNIVYTNDNTNATLSFDMSLADSAGKTLPSVNMPCPVTIQLPHPFVDMDDFVVKHNGVEVQDATYDAATNTISFTTDSFSPFVIEYKDYVDSSLDLAWAENADGSYTITNGMLMVNPMSGFEVGFGTEKTAVAVDSANSVVVNHKRDGSDRYIVSDKATTVFAAADATATYEALTGDVAVTSNQSGKLYSLISNLQNQEHTTLYLLPGTYNEATTIYVYSSMDIIGLGAEDEVKVVKLSSSNSNRHLFNATGSKAEYIEVSLHNLYLDATTNTTGGKDNAAVQSIRKSKVKCYDLTIVKGTGWDAVAFYVNGNNAVDGVKYPAYLYAENCALNTTRTFGVVTTSGSYKFYHSGLIYGGKAYTSNSGSIKNTTMALNTWEW